ncbi:MAG: hypothetical protein QME79_03945 [Bacillota bacterium]|nr:hypothetical protein [Bacillota bacterium]
MTHGGARPTASGAPAVLGSEVIVLTGAYGSGKTELALNLAAYLAGRRPFDSLAWPPGAVPPPPPARKGVTLIDLDTVKPYFRARELEQAFRGFGVRFLGAAEGFAHADVPALSPAILGALRLGRERVVIDLAGEEAGARVLRGLLQSAPNRRVAFLLVVNPFRPFTGDAPAIAATGAALAAAADLDLTGVVANPQLLDQTTEDQVIRGYQEVARAAGELGIPVAWAAARAELCPSLARRLPVPVFAIQRFLRPPWERSS